MPRLRTETVVHVEATRVNYLELPNPPMLCCTLCVFIIDSVKKADGQNIEERYRVDLEMVVVLRSLEQSSLCVRFLLLILLL